MSHSLMTVRYVDGTKGIFLTSYADMVVYDTSGGRKTLCAIRFGGYPEQVSGMVQAIHGGGAVELEVGKERITLHPLVKQYRRKLSHDGVYAEAALAAEDENQQAKTMDENKDKTKKEEEDLDTEEIALDLPPRKSFIYVAPGDKKALYDAIDRKTGVPMIPEFAEYILTELQEAKILTPLTVISSSLKCEAWVLKCSAGDSNIIEIVEKGVKSGKIAIPGAENLKDEAAFDAVNSVTEYLGVYGPQVAERIKNLFIPLFDPVTDQLSPEVLEVNSTIQEKAGYSLYDAQLAVSEAIKRQLARGKAGLIIRDSVEDVSSAFKRMSSVKRRENPLNTPVFTDGPVEIRPAASEKLQIVEFTFMAPAAAAKRVSAVTAEDIFALASQKAGKKKTSVVDENQISLFDKTA